MTAYAQILKAMMVAGALMALAFPAGDAWAGSKVFTIFNQTSTIRGSVETNANGNRDPFVLQVFSSAVNECLLLAVTSQGADLEATLVGPSGRTWQDDDSNGALRPRIRAVTVTRGWHTLILSQFAGTSVNADFTMTILRTSIAACGIVTPPSISANHHADKQGSANPESGPQGGANE